MDPRTADHSLVTATPIASATLSGSVPRRWGWLVGTSLAVLGTVGIARFGAGLTVAQAQQPAAKRPPTAPALPGQTTAPATGSTPSANPVQGPSMVPLRPAAGPQPAVAPTLKIVAQVNNQRVTRQELAEECMKRYGKEVMEMLVNKHLILQECDRLKIQVTDAEVQEEITKIAKRFSLPRDQWLKMLREERDITLEQYSREIIWPALALRRLAAHQLTVTPQEVQQAYDTEFGPAVQARMILVDNLQLAQQLHAQLQADATQFARLAIAHSKDLSTASAGGLMQPIRRHVGYAKVEEHAFALQAGQVSPVFELGKEFVILKCEQRIEARKVAFESVEPALTEGIRDRKLRNASHEVFAELQKRSTVEGVWNNPQLQQQYPGVAVIVNTKQIPMTEFAEECISRRGKEVLEGVISSRVLKQEVAKRQIVVTQADIDQELGTTALSFLPEKDGLPDINGWLQKVSTEQDISVEYYIDEVIWPNVALKKMCFANVDITPDDLQKGFEANFGERVECRAIVFDNQRRAREVWEIARRTPTLENFEALAEQHSVDPASKAMRGVIPPIHRHCGQPLIEKEAFRLAAGELSSVLQVEGRFVVLFCKGRTQPVEANFAVVKDELYKDIFEKKLRVMMADQFTQLKESALIDNFLAGTTQRPRGVDTVATKPAGPTQGPVQGPVQGPQRK